MEYMPRRLDDLIRFCDILETLERRIGGRRLLADCHGRMDWPQRGVYFFMEEGERRTDTGEGLRIVRVGTHALKAGSGTTLWGRLSQHKGQEKSGGGNHRGSIFRLLVGSTLLKAGGMSCPTWGVDSRQLSATRRPQSGGSGGAGGQPDHQGDAIPVARGRRSAGAGEPPRLYREKQHRASERLVGKAAARS